MCAKGLQAGGSCRRGPFPAPVVQHIFPCQQTHLARLTGALLDRLTHHVHLLACNGDSYRLADAKRRRAKPASKTESAT